MAESWNLLPTQCNLLELPTVHHVKIGRVVMAGRVSRRPLELATSVAVLRVTQDLTASSLEPAAGPVIVTYFLLLSVAYISCLQCFDAVGWAAGRASGL